MLCCGLLCVGVFCHVMVCVCCVLMCVVARRCVFVFWLCCVVFYWGVLLGCVVVVVLL